MVDVPSDSTTTRTITVGGSISDTLEKLGDHDWFRINLTAGESISVLLDGITLEDPYLRIRDAQGNILFEIDDIVSGVNRDSLLGFTASYTGIFYIDAGAWDEGYTGNYTLSVSVYTPPPVATVEQAADQLVNGYWSGDSHHFNVTQGGTITVNLTALTAAGQTLARAALATWNDIIGVNFTEVAAGGQITFDDNKAGAFSSSIWADRIISTSQVNVSTQWLADNGTALNGYSFQTYIHEIGHALGLGHGGNYNETARYPYEALFQNDGWPVTVMSYFDQSENTYFAGQGFSQNFITTPMMADIAAMSVLYGLSTTTRVGNTTYGSGWGTAMGALCIFDSGGIDTIDVSAISGNHRIDLNPGSFSNIKSEVGNVSIALGVMIENATGGSGDDTLIGNSADNVLIGGAGNDSVSYASAAAGVTVNLGLAGAQNTIGAGTDTLTGFERLYGSQYGDRLTAGAGITIIHGGGGNDTLIATADGDILMGEAGDDTLISGAGDDQLSGGGGNDTFRDTTGGLSGDTITDFSAGDRIILTNANLGSFSFSLSGSTLTYAGGSLTLTGVTGTLVASAAAGGWVQLSLEASINDARNDFNGDGRSDLAWLNTNGTFTSWQGQPNGSFVANPGSGANALDASWRIVGVGDFNGDGKDDLLWRHQSGVIGQWQGQSNGTFANTSGVAANAVDNSWSVAGVADYNGDGRGDILWRHSSGEVSQWLGQPNGGFANNDGAAANKVDVSWTIVANSDFNGDDRADVLWRHTSGAFAEWQGTASGALVNAGSVLAGASGSVVGSGDFNGDSRDDVLMRAANGSITVWLGQASEQFTSFTPTRQLLDGNWKIVAIGDYNGDGKDDLLWRHGSGEAGEWLATGSGDFAYNGAIPTLDPSWQIQSPDILLV